ncbi:GntR family transcriptional regulator [Achromobacter agilis]|uniref:Putative D-xylose utilization operon transcriptional repressor n=1 Tax=Achromobacter agilis TaxID=1353888 RepID=A0A446CX49_9BURK|nr:GntR family transcriptional regulator [Achromobacter agilis]SSW72409.1 putative D-xylose utilization operon transcriptional repressor [Achromobacter agilis]
MDTLSQHVTDTLRDWVLHGKFNPGARLEEIPLAEKLGVSRTPVRAALATLGNEGLLEHLPKRGYTVRAYDIGEIVAAYEVRAALEGLACRQAALRGLSHDAVAVLKNCLDDGDRILGKGVLLPEDHLPYQQVNITLHNGILEAAGNPWVKRFATQAQAIPYASDRIILWEDHGIILRSHDDHHRIVSAIIARDGARAEDLMREHVYYAGIILKNNYERLAQAYRV